MSASQNESKKLKMETRTHPQKINRSQKHQRFFEQTIWFSIYICEERGRRWNGGTAQGMVSRSELGFLPWQAEALKDLAGLSL